MRTVDDQLLQRYERYLTVQRGLAASTVRAYLSDARTFRDWCRESGEMPQAMDRRIHLSYVTYLVWEAPDRRGGPKRQGLERGTVKRMLAGLRSFFHFLVQEGWFTVTPVPSGRSVPMKTGQPLLSVLNESEANRLLEGCNPQSALEVRNRAMLELLYASGPRLAELHQLDSSDVDLMAYTVTVVGQRDRERTVPFGDKAWVWLSKYLGEARPTLARDDGPALWLNSRGGRLSRKSIDQIVKRYATAAGLGAGVHPHTLRHSFASHLLDGGADIYVVQKLLGHDDTGSTEVYARTAVKGLGRAYMKHHPLAKAGRTRLPVQTTG